MTRTSDEQQVAIVTGASRGIGRAIAEQLADDGFHVVLVARNIEALDEVRDGIIKAGGDASCRPCDLSDGSAFGELVESVADDRGRLDVLVNNAGMTKDGLMLRMSDEDFDAVMAVNLRSVVIGCRAAARPMMKGRWGRIINITSVTGLSGNPGQANYAAAKAGLIGLTKTIAKEFGSKGITSNAVAPGFIETDMTADLGDAVSEGIFKSLPLRRFGQAQDIASAVSFLASDGGGYVTGQVLVVDGGLTC